MQEEIIFGYFIWTYLVAYLVTSHCGIPICELLWVHCGIPICELLRVQCGIRICELLWVHCGIPICELLWVHCGIRICELLWVHCGIRICELLWVHNIGLIVVESLTHIIFESYLLPQFISINTKEFDDKMYTNINF